MRIIKVLVIGLLCGSAPQCVTAEPTIKIFLKGKTQIFNGCSSDSGGDDNSNEQTTGNCPEEEGYIKTSNSQCFKLFEEKGRWERTRVKCSNEGMAMAQPEMEVMDELEEGIKEILCPDGYNCRNVWLGARATDDGKMIWNRDGSEISKSSFEYYYAWSMDHKICLRLDVGNTSADYVLQGDICEHNNSDYPILCEVL